MLINVEIGKSQLRGDNLTYRVKLNKHIPSDPEVPLLAIEHPIPEKTYMYVPGMCIRSIFVVIVALF